MFWLFSALPYPSNIERLVCRGTNASHYISINTGSAAKIVLKQGWQIKKNNLVSSNAHQCFIPLSGCLGEQKPKTSEFGQGLRNLFSQCHIIFVICNMFESICYIFVKKKTLRITLCKQIIESWRMLNVQGRIFVFMFRNISQTSIFLG